MLEKTQVLIRLDPAHPVFRTHFPGMPRVPGSLVVQGFLDLMHNAGLDCEKLVLSRFRFRRFMEPGDYVYELEPVNERKMLCRVRRGETVYCEGVAQWLTW